MATVILVRLSQLPKAEEPMLVTLFGIVTLVRLSQNANADFTQCFQWSKKSYGNNDS